MVWVFIVNLLIGGAAGVVSLDVGPFQTAAQCTAAQQVFNLAAVRNDQGGYFGWTKSICITRP